MNLRHLRYFITVATELNITRSSELLHISQPALSKQIADLERDMGVPLIIRTNRAISLTPAGQVLLQEGMAFLDQESRLYSRVREAADDAPKRLSVGYIGAIEANGLPVLTARFKEEAPEVSLNIRRFGWRALIQALSTGEMDVGLITMRVPEDIPAPLKYEVLLSDPACLITNGEHPFAALKSVQLSMLPEQQYIIVKRDVEPTVYDMLTNLFGGTGKTPHIVSEHEMVETVLMLVQSGIGVTLLSSQIGSKFLLGLRSIPVEDAPHVNLVVVWNQNNSNPYIERFIRLARANKWDSQSE